MHQDIKKGKGHPTLAVLQGFDQPGPQEKTCYGCGEKGTSRVTQIVRQVQTKFGQVPPRVSKHELKTVGKEDQAKGKGAVEPGPRLEIAKDL